MSHPKLRDDSCLIMILLRLLLKLYIVPAGLAGRDGGHYNRCLIAPCGYFDLVVTLYKVELDGVGFGGVTTIYNSRRYHVGVGVEDEKLSTVDNLLAAGIYHA